MMGKGGKKERNLGKGGNLGKEGGNLGKNIYEKQEGNICEKILLWIIGSRGKSKACSEIQLSLLVFHLLSLFLLPPL